ncbi:MAG TPA: Nif3-like dinuclear metal center hexameric protein [Elusimicrobiales bacterium]|nr:Nif3-like dinuclear metal center hexameric protein [Elusimicrobiales bacterium]
MADRDSIIAFLDKYLEKDAYEDDSLNGLQVEGAAKVHKIAVGVSASLEFFRRSAAACADLLIVHHGLLWARQKRIVAAQRAKIKFLLDNGLSLAGYHLPLDAHGEVGNNRSIMRYLGAKSLKPFGLYHNKPIGCQGVLPKPLTANQVSAVLAARLGATPQVFAGGPGKLRTLAVVSGGAASMLEAAADARLDLYITGEPSEYVPEQCKECGITCIAAGHYNSEKAGVLSLVPVLSGKFKIPVEFIDVPNPI